MIEIESSPLNSFGPQGLESPSEEIFVLTSGQLEALISRAVTRAQAPLLERLEATEARISRLEDSLEEGVGAEGEEPWPQVIQERPGGQGGHIPTFQIVHSLQAENHALKSELEALQEATARERAYDRQRIAKLEEREKEPGKAEIDKTEDLYSHMKLVGLKQTTFSGAAKILQVSKGRVHQLKTAIALDQRFIILPSESHKQRLVIRLREYQKI